MNNRLNPLKNIKPNHESIFINPLYLYLLGTLLLLIVFKAIQANSGAERKLPVMAPKTKSFTVTPPALEISRAINDASI